MKTTAKKARRHTLAPKKATGTVRLSVRKIEKSQIVSFTTAFYAKHGSVMSKLSHE